MNKRFLIIPALLVLLPLGARAVTTVDQVNTKHAVLAQEFEGGESEGDGEQQYVPTPLIQKDNSLPTQAAPPVTNPTNTQPQVQAPATPFSTAFPWAWVVTRTAGITSYILLALQTVTGIALSTGLLFRMFSPATSWSIHRAIGSAMLVSVLLHVGSMLFDHFIGLKLVDILVPFASFYRPTLVALGIFGFYSLLLVLGTSLYSMTNHPRFWRVLHYLGFPMFVSIFLHAILIGTDRHQPLMVFMYWSSALLVAVFVTYRLVWKYRQPTDL